jgi:hypothetical protein
MPFFFLITTQYPRYVLQRNHVPPPRAIALAPFLVLLSRSIARIRTSSLFRLASARVSPFCQYACCVLSARSKISHFVSLMTGEWTTTRFRRSLPISLPNTRTSLACTYRVSNHVLWFLLLAFILLNQPTNQSIHPSINHGKSILNEP